MNVPLPFPDVDPEQQGAAEFWLRYADVDERGALKFGALPLALERCGWDRVVTPGLPMERLATEHGILAILTRFHMRCGRGPVSVNDLVRGRGAYELAHTVDESGAPNRVLFNLYAGIQGTVGSTHGPAPEGAGRDIALGEVIAEHVFTRPFAPAGSRRVRELPPECGVESVPGPRTPWVIPSTIGRPPKEARRLDRDATFARRVVFGLAHTDSNRHVNSLVYPRLFEEMALERLHDHGVSTASLLVTDLEIAYRKPCFAGQRIDVTLQALRDGDRYGAVGAFVPVDTDDRRPHCYVQIWF